MMTYIICATIHFSACFAFNSLIYSPSTRFLLHDFFLGTHFGDFWLSLPRQTLTTHSAFFSAEICVEPKASDEMKININKMEEEKPLYLFFSYTNGVEIGATSNISCRLTATKYTAKMSDGKY